MKDELQINSFFDRWNKEWNEDQKARHIQDIKTMEEEKKELLENAENEQKLQELIVIEHKTVYKNISNILSAKNMNYTMDQNTTVENVIDFFEMNFSVNENSDENNANENKMDEDSKQVTIYIY